MAGQELPVSESAVKPAAGVEQLTSSLDRYHLPSPLTLELQSILGPDGRAQFREKSPAW